jgi:hypothetical protein
LVAAGWAAAHTNEEALVTADDRVHWGDLSPGRRQRIILAVSMGAVLAAAGATIAGVGALAVRRRRH